MPDIARDHLESTKISNLFLTVKLIFGLDSSELANHFHKDSEYINNHSRVCITSCLQNDIGAIRVVPREKKLTKS